VTTTGPGGLVERLARDVDSAFPDLVSDYGGVVYTAALRTTGCPADAEDLAAETFLRAYAALRGYPPERIAGLAVRPWLVTILLNLERNRRRMLARRPAHVPLEAGNEPAARGEGPEQRTARHESGDLLAGLLGRLPERQRVAIVLRHIVDLGYPEIAGVLGVAEGTVKSDVSRGLTRLRGLASAAGLEEGPS